MYDHLIAQKFNSSQSHSSGDDGNSSEVHLARILQILREFSTDYILSIYVIDDIWEYMDAMKDWTRIISLLLEDNSSIELTDDDATNLTRLLCASVRKAVGDRIVPATDYRKQNFTKAQRETIENNRRDITISMMKNYAQLLRKFMADKAKVPSLLDIIVHMNLELYSLKRQEENFRAVLQLMKEAFFKHGEKDALRSCVKAMNFCSTGSRGELQDFTQNKLKELEADLTAKLKSAIKGVVDGDDEYSLLVNLKRLYELQLLRSVPIEGLYEDFAMILRTFQNIEDEVLGFLLLNMHLHVSWCLHSVVNSEVVSETALSSLLSKRTALFEQLEQFLQILPKAQEEGKSGNLLACRVCTILAESWCLFKKTSFASTKLENLGYCPDDSTVRKFWKLCEKQLYISDETEDEDVNKEYIEEINRDAIMVAAAKLVAIDTVPKGYLGPEIISHFVMHGTSVAEIVKYLIAVLKKKEEDVSNIFLEAMKQAYGRHLVVPSSSDGESLSGKSFQECKDLAARLSGIFAGAARNKHRVDILKIVKEGIEYAFVDAPRHMSFLVCAVQPFVSKLPVPDILDILKDAQKRTENVNTEEDPSGWRPYYTFVDTLRDKYMKNEDEKEGTTVRRRGRPRKTRNLEGKKLFDEHSSSEDEDSISVSDQDAPDDEENQEVEDEAPLIHSLKTSSKLRSLRVSREENKGQTTSGTSRKVI